MPLITANLLGRFGNQAMQYCFAKAYAEKHGCDFQCEHWIGHRIFELNDVGISVDLPRRSEIDLKDGETNFNFRGYAQHQRCMIYTKEQVRRWFRLRPQIEEALEQWRPKDDTLLAHRRTGDYFGYGYVVVSEKSYKDACDKFGLDKKKLRFVSEEEPGFCAGFSGDYAFLPDFYRLIKAKVLLRGNSTFSWMAAFLSDAEIYSPVIDGLLGGREHDCEFVRGNHPRFCNLGFVTDLHEAVHRES